MVVGGLGVAAGLAAGSALWVSPWRLFFESELYRNWGELVLVAVFLALCLFWGLMERRSRVRFWLGVLAVALGVKLALNDGPIAHTVTDAALAVPRAAKRFFR